MFLHTSLLEDVHGSQVPAICPEFDIALVTKHQIKGGLALCNYLAFDCSHTSHIENSHSGAKVWQYIAASCIAK